jgi:methylenetetrahydrofolate reductase (NADPH)
MVVASAAMARKLGAESAQLAVPEWLVDAVDADRMAGVEAACALVERVRDHGGFAGAHLVGVGRYRDVAARLEATGWAGRPGTARSPGPASR